MNIELMVNKITEDTDKKFRFTFPNAKTAKSACTNIRVQAKEYEAVLSLLNIEGKLAIRYQGQTEDGQLIYVFGLYPTTNEPKFTVEEI